MVIELSNSINQKELRKTHLPHTLISYIVSFDIYLYILYFFYNQKLIKIHQIIFYTFIQNKKKKKTNKQVWQVYYYEVFACT